MDITLGSDFFQVITKLKFTMELYYTIIFCHGLSCSAFIESFTQKATIILFLSFSVFQSCDV